MTPVFTARRRAEEFAALVEGTATADARYAEFLDVVASLRDVSAPEPRSEFVTDLRTQLMTAADTLLVPNDDDRLVLPQRKTSRDRRIAVTVGGFALVGATTSMAMAAQTALPGDALYPLKRAIENAHTGISVGEGQQGSTLLANASGRLLEATELSREGSLEDGAAVAATLTTFTEQATEASDLLLEDYEANGHESSIEELRDFTAESIEQLAALEAIVPAEARDELLYAARVLAQIDAEAEQACPNCGGTGITEIPSILVSGGLDTTQQRSRLTPASTAQVIKPAKDKGKRSAKGGQGADAGAANDPLPSDQVLSPPAETDDGAEAAPTDEGQESGQNPVGTLTEGLTGGSQPTNNPTNPALPDPGDVADGAGDAVDDLTP